jgi:hypothetical protein
MTAPVLPFAPGAARAFLAASTDFTALVPAGRISTRAPADVTSPFVLVRSAGGALPIDVSAGAWSPLVQVEGYAPTGGTADPEVVVWRLAATAAALLARARNVAYDSMRWSARITDGPITDVDTSRGSSAPLYRAFVRAEITLHAR